MNVRLFAHAKHWYTDRARHNDHRWMPGQVYDVDVDVATYMVQSHPQLFCVLNDNDTAAGHRQSCHKPTEEDVEAVLVGGGYEDREMTSPPQDKELTPTRGSKGK
jgi:hypothetical protein